MNSEMPTSHTGPTKIVNESSESFEDAPILELLGKDVAKMTSAELTTMVEQLRAARATGVARALEAKPKSKKSPFSIDKLLGEL